MKKQFKLEVKKGENRNWLELCLKYSKLHSKKTEIDVNDDIIRLKSAKIILKLNYLSFEPKHDMFWFRLDDDLYLTSA